MAMSPALPAGSAHFDRDVVGALLARLNPQQRAAVETAHGPVAILAGAGTGKTRTITHRIAYQVATGVARADQIMAVTFTERAAAELGTRLGALGIPATVRAATFHAAAWAQLRYFWPRVSALPIPEILPSKLRLLIDDARQLGVEARDLAAEIEWAKARGLTARDYAGLGRRGAPLPPAAMAQVYTDYERRKEAAAAIDYDDMLLRMTELLGEHADIAAEVADRYRYFTVDEFQDVNPAQWALLRAWLNGREDLCVVGDDHQAIYGFTGASSRYLTDFRKHFPQARLLPLTINYRSTSEILAAANAVLGPRVARDRILRGQQPSGPKPVIRPFDDGDAEIAGVTAYVAALVAQGIAVSEIAICYRVNRQSEAFEQALGNAGIPFAVRGEGGFFHRKEIRQALRVLRDAVQRPPPTGSAGARPGRQIERILRERLGWHPRKAPDGQAARDRWRNLGLLHELATSASRDDPTATLDDVVAMLDARANASSGDGRDADAVSLLTLHRAKGLEFDAVLLVSLEEGLLPIGHARGGDELEEERRLLHVGMTRARTHLWLSWAQSRIGPSGHQRRRRPSRFLAELGAR